MFSNSYAGKKVFVTGNTGFKGSWLTAWLLQLGADVTGYSINTPSEPSNFEALGLRKKVRQYWADVRDYSTLECAMAESAPDIVFHLAAQAIVRKSYDDPKLTFDTNFGGTVNILEAIRHNSSVQAGVLITSDKCYENVEWEYGYRETDRLGGKDPYSASKACAEIAFSAYARSFFSDGQWPRIAATRAGNVIGGGDWAADRIVPDCIRSWARGETVLIRSPEATRPWQHVLEPLSGYLWLGSRLLEGQDALSGESFNFGPAPDVTQSVEDLIREMTNTWLDGRWKIDSAEKVHKKEAGLLKLSCDKALRSLSWKATLSYAETVTMTAEWYQKYYREKTGMDAFTMGQINTYQKKALERNLLWAK